METPLSFRKTCGLLSDHERILSDPGRHDQRIGHLAQPGRICMIFSTFSCDRGAWGCLEVEVEFPILKQTHLAVQAIGMTHRPRPSATQVPTCSCRLGATERSPYPDSTVSKSTGSAVRLRRVGAPVMPPGVIRVIPLVSTLIYWTNQFGQTAG